MQRWRSKGEVLEHIPCGCAHQILMLCIAARSATVAVSGLLLDNEATKEPRINISIDKYRAIGQFSRVKGSIVSRLSVWMMSWWPFVKAGHLNGSILSQLCSSFTGIEFKISLTLLVDCPKNGCPTSYVVCRDE
jgi:hypothetical protein